MSMGELDELGKLLDVPFVFWGCPRGCRGMVEWSDDRADATCKVCGRRKSDPPEADGWYLFREHPGRLWRATKLDGGIVTAPWIEPGGEIPLADRIGRLIRDGDGLMDEPRWDARRR